MSELTPEQEQALIQKAEEIYPQDRLVELNADRSVRTWWSTRADELSQRMLEIDRDQMRSAAESHNKWVR